jgi:hypothetical protein
MVLPPECRRSDQGSGWPAGLLEMALGHLFIYNLSFFEQAREAGIIFFLKKKRSATT